MKEPNWIQEFLSDASPTTVERAECIVHGMRLFALSAHRDLSPKSELSWPDARSHLVGRWNAQCLEAISIVLGHMMQGCLRADSCAHFVSPRSDISSAWSQVCQRVDSAPWVGWPLASYPSPWGAGVPHQELVSMALEWAKEWGMDAQVLEHWELRWVWVKDGGHKARPRLKRLLKCCRLTSLAVELSLDLACLSLQEGCANTIQAISGSTALSVTQRERVTWLQGWASQVLPGFPGASNLDQTYGWPDSGSENRPWRTRHDDESLGLRLGHGMFALEPNWDGLMGAMQVSVGRLPKHSLTEGVEWHCVKPGDTESSDSPSALGEIERLAIGSGCLEVAYSNSLNTTLWETGSFKVRAVAVFPFRGLDGRTLALVRWEWGHWYLPDLASMEVAGGKLARHELSQSRLLGKPAKHSSVIALGTAVEFLIKESGGTDSDMGWRVWTIRSGEWCALGASASLAAGAVNGLERLWRCGQSGEAQWVGPSGVTPATGAFTVLPLCFAGRLQCVLEIQSKSNTDLQRIRDLWNGQGSVAREARVCDWLCHTFMGSRGWANLQSEGAIAVRQLFWEEESVVGFVKRVIDCISNGVVVLLQGADGSGVRFLGAWIEYCVSDWNFGCQDGRLAPFPIEGEGGIQSEAGEMRLVQTFVWSCGEWKGHSASMKDRVKRLERLGLPVRVFSVPGLDQRRNEVLDWLKRWQVDEASSWGAWSAARNVARRRASPSIEMRRRAFSDPLLACLWRQSWPGQVPQLKSIAELLWRGAGVEPSEDVVQRIFTNHGLVYIDRLASKRPLPMDIASALWITKTARGRWNKKRAALYLGWDPDTLSARMKDLGWDNGDVPQPDPWKVDRGLLDEGAANS